MLNEPVTGAAMKNVVSDGNSITPGGGAHPNELDLRRITRMLARRVRYRYVVPEVRGVVGGYHIVSPCCSRNVDSQGGVIDIARLEQAGGTWRIYWKNHQLGVWQWYAEGSRLQELIMQLNEDPSRVFWQ